MTEPRKQKRSESPNRLSPHRRAISPPPFQQQVAASALGAIAAVRVSGLIHIDTTAGKRPVGTALSDRRETTCRHNTSNDRRETPERKVSTKGAVCC